MLYQVKNKLVFKAIDFSILLLLNATYYAAGMLLLDEIESGKYQGLFTLSVGIVNLALAWYFFRRQNTDKNFLYLLIGLTLTFLSLTIPIQLEGHAITMFWSAEFVLLFWLYQRSQDTDISIRFFTGCCFGCRQPFYGLGAGSERKSTSGINIYGY